MKFSDIPGQEEAKRQLRALADSGRIPHAVLLEGPQGSGKYALARAFAQYVHCEHPVDGDSCGVCPACRQHQTFNHVDTMFSFPIVNKDGAGKLSNDYIEEFHEQMEDSPFMDFEQWLLKLNAGNSQPIIYADEVNELIRRLNYTTHNSRYNIVLMWLPERLQEVAANKLLKMIEEPPADTLFILSSDNPRAILPTVYSRLRRIPVKRYGEDEIAAILQSRYGADPRQSADIARLADGSLVEAQKLVSLSKERAEYLEMFMQLMRMAYVRKVAELRKWADDLAAMGREREMRFYEYCARMIRENFFMKLQEPSLNALTADEAAFSSRFSPFINEKNVLKLFKVVNDAFADIAANSNGKIVNFDVAVKVILLIKQGTNG